MNNKMRDQFEAYWKRQLWAECYADVKEQMFTIWRASREAVAVELPKSRADKGETANGDQSLLSALMANHMAIEQCRESILAQGLQVAP